MTLTEQVLANAKKGMEYCDNNGYNVWIQTREGDEHHIEWMVQKGNWYFNGQRPNEYVYWNGQSYGFTFHKSLFAGENNQGEAKNGK